MSLKQQENELAAIEAAANQEELANQAAAQQSQVEFNPGTDTPDGPTLPAQEKPLDMEFVGILGLGVAGIFGIIATRRGPHWQLQPEEIETLAIPLARVLDKYFPDLSKASGPEMALMIAALGIASPRLLQDVSRKEKPVNQEAEQATQEAPTMHDLDAALKASEE